MSERFVPSRDEILKPEELEMALKDISDEKIKKADLPTVWFGRDRRYIWGQVLDFLAERASGDAT